jgi:hypothetical protein
MISFFFACTIKGNAFFGFPPWWKYIKDTETDALGTCVPKFNFPTDTWAVGLAVIGMLLYLAGIVAVASIIIAGISYITAGGQPEKTAAARKRIYNALIGLAIVLTASGVVAFIGNKVG